MAHYFYSINQDSYNGANAISWNRVTIAFCNRVKGKLLDGSRNNIHSSPVLPSSVQILTRDPINIVPP